MRWGPVAGPPVPGPVGVWWSGSWKAESEPGLDVAAELERLGFGAIWSSGGFDPGLSSRFGRLLASTSSIVVASGIVNIWKSSPGQLVPSAVDLEARFPGRFLLGLGASHAPIVENYARPYGHMVEYLDTLDAGGAGDPSVSKERRVLAALGPRMLELAAVRARGAHPYFVPVEHSARARKVMGPGPLLAPEVAVVLEGDPAKARAVARGYMNLYLTLPNYTNNLRNFGFDDDDFAHGGSDRLVDAIVAWGDARTVATRVVEHHQAGADHVCVQVVGHHNGFPIQDYRSLAEALAENLGSPR